MDKPDFTHHTDLAAPRLGSRVVLATDDFFADKSRLIDPQDPVFIEGKYDDNGKWMDGWESRRRRTPGHDYAIIRLGRPGTISGFDIDTSHFTGNFPPFARIEFARSDQDIPEDTDWVEAVAKTRLSGNAHHYFTPKTQAVWSHVRLHIYPDGGVARLRVYGQVHTDWAQFDRSRLIDLAALEWGGRAIGCSDAHFGVPENLIAPGKGINMGDGWETRRHPLRGSDDEYWTKAHDFAVLALAHRGMVERLIIDTAFFKGNYPDRASLQAADISGLSDDEVLVQSAHWQDLLTPQKLSMDTEHIFTDALAAIGPITHIRLNIFPDGGVSRLRLFGKIT
ncbi:MAG TPA: allantoicase [Hellea balneolensis]|uniref:Probable allantoicase n=1 Tax=Hellea balneolensis TaxID=287478 RepID=A0A7C5R7N5_9PROT|nr:allantoicase [Hellea balneolensis]